MHVEPQIMKSMMEDQGLEIIARENNRTRPRVFYRQLFRFDGCFIAGSVVSVAGDTIDCASGAKVELFKANQMIDQKTTDAFGDFKFDGLKKDSGEYRIEVDYQTLGRQNIQVNLGDSQVLGDIRFEEGL